MSLTEPFDPTLYTRAPILTVATAITLGGALVSACPPSAAPTIRRAADKLQTTTAAAQTAWAARKRALGALSDEDSRVLDAQADGCWSALRGRLESYALLPIEDYPRAARAGELVFILFGKDGLEFLKHRYVNQLPAMQTLLQRIDDEGLQPDLDELAGPEFLAAIRKIVPRYDAMVKAMLQRDETSGVSLLEHVRAVQRAIVAYATRVCAWVDDEDPTTAATATEMLRPLVRFRETTGRRAGSQDAGAGEAEGGGTEGDGAVAGGAEVGEPTPK